MATVDMDGTPFQIGNIQDQTISTGRRAQCVGSVERKSAGCIPIPPRHPVRATNVTLLGGTIQLQDDP